MGGGPAHFLMTLEDYYEKRKDAQICEAKGLVRNYRLVYGRDLDEGAMSEFFWFFSNDAGDTRCVRRGMRLIQLGNFIHMKKNGLICRHF